MKGAKEYLDYCNTHEGECESINNLTEEEFAKHIKELGFEFSRDEYFAELEKTVRLDDMAAVTGGINSDYIPPYKERGSSMNLNETRDRCIGSCWQA